MPFINVSKLFIPGALLACAVAIAGCASDGDTGVLIPAHRGSDAVGPANPATSADVGASYIGSNNSANTASNGGSAAPSYGK